MLSKRRKHHKIATFPTEVQSAVNDLLAGGVTYEEITHRLRDLGHQVGKSSVARYGKEFAAQLEAAQKTKDFMRTLVDEVGMDPLELESGAIKLSLHRAVETVMKAEATGDEDPMEAIRAIGLLAKSSAHVETVRMKFRAEQKAKAAEAADQVKAIAKKGGLSDEMIREIEEKVLGIAA
jgi:hypothetical protein